MSKHEKESTHAIAIGICMKKFKYFSIYKTNYYSGFREADFLDFSLFFIFKCFFHCISLRQKTKNQLPCFFFVVDIAIRKVCLFFFQFVTSTKIKTKNFGLSIWFLVIG